MIDIGSFDKKEILDLIKSYDEPSYRADQIFSWIHNKKISSIDDMTNISARLRKRLLSDCIVLFPTIIKKIVSSNKDTTKYLLKLHDDNIIETVLMHHDYGYSICISSQVGCAMGCSFCASTIDGLVRNLSPYEMLSQIYAVTNDNNIRISSIVVMGSGEPLSNYDNLLRFYRIITNSDGYNLTGRGVTVSTCGIVPNILKLADDNTAITLAISLHASNDDIRKNIMPIAHKYPIKDIIKASDYYFEKTSRRISYEYALISGINDSIDNARELGRLLKNKSCHVNLIPINDVKERNYIKPDYKKIISFLRELEKNGINATIRKEMGGDIDGACGQLRRHYAMKGKGIT